MGAVAVKSGLGCHRKKFGELNGNPGCAAQQDESHLIHLKEVAVRRLRKEHCCIV